MRVTTTKILGSLGLLLCIVLSVNVPSISSQNLYLRESRYTAAEGSFANVSICHSPPVVDTSFQVSTVNITAYSGDDFLHIDQIVTIPAGTMCISQFISIYPDTETEESEFFTLRVGTLAQSAFITITDERSFVTADDVDPVVTCIDDFTHLASAGSGGDRVQFTEPTATDNSDSVAILSASHRPGQFFNTGLTIVTYIFIDPSGNKASCQFQVTVTEGSSNSNPVISSCPSVDLITVTSVGTTQKHLQFTPPTCVDEEDGSRSVLCTPISGYVVLNEVTSITCTCSDTQQQSDSCSVSLSARMESCPQSQEIPIGSQLIFPAPSCYDNNNNFVEASTCNPSSGTFPSTLTIVTCHCRLQPALQCTFTVVVSQERIDPCPQTQVISSGSQVEFSPPSCYDSTGTMYSSTCNPPSGTSLTTSITVTCQCSLQPSLQCAFDVTVSQEGTTSMPPSSTTTPAPGLKTHPVVTCPDALVVPFFADNVGYSATWDPPTCVDAEDGIITTAVCVPASGSFFQDVGVNTVTCTCTDSDGLSDECIFSVTVQAPDSIPMLELLDQETAVNSSSVILTVPKVDERSGPISCYEFVVVKRRAGESGGGSPDDVQFDEIKMEPGNEDSPYRSVVMNHAAYMDKTTVTIGSDANTVTRCTLEVTISRRQKRANMVVGGGDLEATNAPLDSGTNYDIFMRAYSETSGGMFQYTSSDYLNVTTTGGGPSAGLIAFLVILTLVLLIIVVSVAVFVVRYKIAHKKEERSTGLDDAYANEGMVQGLSSLHARSKDRDMLSYENVPNPKGKDNLSYEHVGNPSQMKKPIFQPGHPLTHTKKQPKEKTSSIKYEETSFNKLQKGSNELDTEGVIYEEMPEDSNNYDQAVYAKDEAPLPVKVSELPDYINKKRYQKNGLEREFKLLPKGQHHPWTIATKAGNRHMNYIPNVLPYDHSRVKLTKMQGTHSSDYYNASFIMDQHNKQAFIAAQGPYDNTVQEFLRLIWQEKVSIVIMVTPVEESGKKLCSKYWPSKVGGKSSCGNINVTLAWEEHYPDYSIRQLMIHPEDKSATNVLQFHFPSWPYMGVPKKPTSVIRFIRYIKEALQERHLPVLVHCSDGSGATGTLIAAFCLMDELEADDEICIYEFVKKMRKNRMNMVQTKAQYTFLYDILLQAYLMPHSELSAKQLKDMTIRKYFFSKEFQALKNPKYNIAAQSGASPENQGKNRYESIIPLDVHRPKLKCTSLTGGNNYINACFVDGYRDKNAFVMTQSPLPTTVEDFWRLVIDLQCSTIVMLNETKSSDSKSCVCYWPSGGNVHYGNILVSCVSTADEHTYVHRLFNVTHQSQKTVVSVDHFQLKKWPQNISVWRDFITSLPVETDAGPTIVHCVDGCGHSGVLLTVLKELQRLKQKQMVNVFETVQELRDSNPHAMQTLEHYTLCYGILQELAHHTQ